jgi:tellurite methyltransferase
MDLFNTSYEENKDFYRWLQPSDIIVSLANLLEWKKNIADIGAGEGRNAIYLAQRWHTVTAIDTAKAWLEKLEIYTLQNKLQIQCMCNDIEDFLDTEKIYDVLVCNQVLHCLQHEKIPNIIQKMQERTQKNWYNAIGSFIAPDEATKNILIERWQHLFREQELLEYYKDWKVSLYKEERWPEETHGEKPHRHYIVTLLAQKNNE